MKNLNEKLFILDRKSTRLNSSYTVIYTLSLHDALPIFREELKRLANDLVVRDLYFSFRLAEHEELERETIYLRSEEHTSELQLHSDLHSFPTRRSSDL